MSTVRNSSRKLIWLALALSVLHHVDHILRVDHSGWPFVPHASPFTYSLLVYPVFAILLMVPLKPWLRVTGVTLLFLVATLAHIFFEPLRDKFHTWTYGSDLPGHVGEQNLLGIHSKFMGVYSVTLAVSLSLVLLLALLAAIREARHSGSSLKAG